MFVISVGEEGGTESGIEDEETIARIPWYTCSFCIIYNQGFDRQTKKILNQNILEL